MKVFFGRSKSVRSGAVGLGQMVLLLLAMALPGVMRAQVAGATLSGEVTDKSGAVVPGAAVSIRNTATGQVRAVKSNGSC